MTAVLSLRNPSFSHIYAVNTISDNRSLSHGLLSTKLVLYPLEEAVMQPVSDLSDLQAGRLRDSNIQYIDKALILHP